MVIEIYLPHDTYGYYKRGLQIQGNNMRLTIYEISSIKDAFKKVFGDGEIYLFGSRVDDGLKGGDIDLYIKPASALTTKDRLNKKNKLRMLLEDKIGEQKIDLVISKNTTNSIEQEALQKGIKL